MTDRERILEHTGCDSGFCNARCSMTINALLDDRERLRLSLRDIVECERKNILRMGAQIETAEAFEFLKDIAKPALAASDATTKKILGEG